MMRALLMISLVAVSLAGPANAHAAEANASAFAAVPPGVVDGRTAQRLVAAGARLVDVRTAQEFEAGHVPGATLIPFDQIAARAAELGPKDAPIVLYCRSGRRTAIAKQALEAQGFTRVWDMQGIQNWTGAGR
jgi:rhodanese-related sulfurtransferase